ncbi:hypothetical protein Maq22A_c28240 [Methylobacterium aquaticum]|uniref:Uncharacterized protein n=1 Tax=Methylobacterium aquaticum TaxID=270351 RepID=A0A1Y0ZIK6_9HYPH|nr:hypothetical protein Maq22A_c28240 [Methylobacterium aquaticum]
MKPAAARNPARNPAIPRVRERTADRAWPALASPHRDHRSAQRRCDTAPERDGLHPRGDPPGSLSRRHSRLPQAGPLRPSTTPRGDDGLVAGRLATATALPRSPHVG